MLTQYSGTGLPAPVLSPARFTTTANIALTGLGVQAGGDWGGALTAGDRILVKNQAAPANNGVYVAAAGAWSRSVDMNTSAECVPGMTITVSEGVTLADTMWELSANAPITIGVTALTFVQVGGGGGLEVGVTAIASGTVGALLYEGTGNVLEEDATKLFWDEGNEFLGVGTNAPANHLDVVNSAVAGAVAIGIENLNVTGVTAINMGESAGDSSFYIQRYNSNYAIAALREGVILYNADNAFMAFGTNNLERMRILSDGYVGVNIDAPTALIHVKGAGATSATYALKVENSAATTLFQVRDDNHFIGGEVGGDLFFGLSCALNETGAGDNTGFGVNAMNALLGGSNNTSVGSSSLYAVTSGSLNTSVGSNSLKNITTGFDNVGIGYFAGTSFGTSSGQNTLIGSGAGGSATATVKNGWAAVGFGAGSAINGSYIVAIGNRAGTSWKGATTVSHEYSAYIGGGFSSSSNELSLGGRGYDANVFYNNIYLNGRFGQNGSMQAVTIQPMSIVDVSFSTSTVASSLWGAAVTDGNASAATFTIAGSQGTGTGLGGDIIFKVAPAGTTGNTNNALVEVFRVYQAGVVNFSKRLNEQQGADVASAAGAIALGLDGNAFEITGTSAITLISNLNWQNGSKITLYFTSTASLVHNTATSGTDITILLDGSVNYVGSAGSRITLELGEIGGTQAWREISRSAPSQSAIDTTAGDSATINAIAGRFRKDVSGTTFTLTNSYITANSIIMLTQADAALDATATRWTVSAGAGSATITFDAAPTANLNMNFFVIN